MNGEKNIDFLDNMGIVPYYFNLEEAQAELDKLPADTLSDKDKKRISKEITILKEKL